MENDKKHQYLVQFEGSDTDAERILRELRRIVYFHEVDDQTTVKISVEELPRVSHLHRGPVAKMADIHSGFKKSRSELLWLPCHFCKTVGPCSHRTGFEEDLWGGQPLE